MEKKKKWILRLFLIFFTMSVSVAVLPCGIINCYGLFGEATTCVVDEEKEQEIINIKHIDSEKAQTAKGANIFNIWFEILTAVACICFCAGLVRLPRGDTIVTLKIRMDN